MKTALKIIGGIIVTLIAAVAIFYFGWLSPPPADDVCDNVVKISRADAEKAGATVSDADVAELKAGCMKHASNAPEFGQGVWVKQLKCMRDADSMDALAKCEDIKGM